MSTSTSYFLYPSCRLDTPFCGCGEKAILNTSWTNNNPGRRFWGCPKFRAKSSSRNCDLFQWLDPPVEDRHKAILIELLNKDEALATQRYKEDKYMIILAGLLNKIVTCEDAIRRQTKEKILYLFVGMILCYVYCNLF